MIGYLGPEGTFSHLAAINYTQKKEGIQEYPSIYTLIQAVEDGMIEKAIVPIENSIEGSINITLDALAYDVNLFIVGEYVLNICQNLMVKKGTKKEDIKIIASHSSPFGQCSKMLNREFPNVRLVSAPSTADAARQASVSDGSVAALGSINCADIYNLDVLMENCNDEDTNSTRFVIISKTPCTTVTDKDKSSVVFALDHKPGTLYKALSLFEQSNINLLKIESRPLKTGLGKYIFFIDIEGNIDTPTIYFALDRIRQNTLTYKFLGSYKSDR